jgi:hypothetical protein
MIYRVDLTIKIKKCYIEPRSGSKIPYLTAKEMRLLYPDENFSIVGELGGLVKPPSDGDELLTATGRRIPILPRGSHQKPFEWVAGYIPMEGRLYAAAIRNLIPSFLQLRLKI